MPEQPVYNLKAVLRETGLNAETVRAWERRYGLPAPERTPGGHRLYSLRDVQMLKWLVNRQSEGMSISRAVSLWRSLEASGQDPLLDRPEGVIKLSPASNSLDELRREWISYCLKFDETRADQALTQAFAIAAPETVVTEILQQGLSGIGEMWYLGDASVQQEHFASSLAMRKLHSLVAAAPPPTRPVRLLAACPSDEQHEFGLLISTYLLRRHGWDVVYLGANVPLFRLEATLISARPGLVISLAETLPSAASLKDMSEFLYGLNMPMAFGGKIFNLHPDLAERISGHFLGEQISSVPAQVERIIRERPEVVRVPNMSREYRIALEAFQDNMPMVQVAVVRNLRQAGISQSHVEIANFFFNQYLEAALTFGDLSLLDSSIDWIRGLLKQAGVPNGVLQAFLSVYRDALDSQLDGKISTVLEWLDTYVKIHEGIGGAWS